MVHCQRIKIKKIVIALKQGWPGQYPGAKNACQDILKWPLMFLSLVFQNTQSKTELLDKQDRFETYFKDCEREFFRYKKKERKKERKKEKDKKRKD